MGSEHLAAPPGAGLGGTPGAADDLSWSVRRAPYLRLVALWAASVFGLLAARIAGSELVWLAAAVSAVLGVPALPSLRLLLGKEVYRLTADALCVTRGARTSRYPLDAIVGIYSPLIHKPRKRNGAIVLSTRAAEVIIPRWLDADSQKLLRELLTRTAALHRPHHVSRAEGRPWPGYAGVPPEVTDIQKDLASREAVADTYLFTNVRRKYTGSGRSAWWVLGSPFLFGLAMSSYAVSSEWGVCGTGLIVVAVSGVLILLLTAFRRSIRGPEWLLLHREGIAMVGKRLTGELDWGEVTELTDKPARWSWAGFQGVPPSPTGKYFRVHTMDGAVIGVPDIYDAPLQVIYGICQEHLAGQRGTGA